MIWCGLKIEENYHELLNQFHGNYHYKTLSCWKIKCVLRDVKWCINASWGLKGLIRLYMYHKICHYRCYTTIIGGFTIIVPCSYLTLKHFFISTMETNLGFIQFEIIINVIVSSFCFIWIPGTNDVGLRHNKFVFFQTITFNNGWEMLYVSTTTWSHHLLVQLLRYASVAK